MIVWPAYKTFPLESVRTEKDYFLLNFYLQSRVNQRLSTVFSTNEGMTYKIFPLAVFVIN